MPSALVSGLRPGDTLGPKKEVYSPFKARNRAQSLLHTGQLLSLSYALNVMGPLLRFE